MVLVFGLTSQRASAWPTPPAAIRDWMVGGHGHKLVKPYSPAEAEAVHGVLTVPG